ncbi:hypothetical protein J3R83DRAFT_7580 [Lanmaoa asiatica]|nr:hypothetical protein J3R83DRAFT_7580 [Lanmaoa asiatica]
MTSLVYATFGALLLGGFCAAALSGVVAVQTFLYIKLFPEDSARVKAIVSCPWWMLDTTHSLLVYTSIWICLITNYGDEMKIDTISMYCDPVTLYTGLTAAVQAILTFIVHWYISSHASLVSRQRWRYTALIVSTCFTEIWIWDSSKIPSEHGKRVSSGPSLTIFLPQQWVFTLGLAMSCLVDILVTGFLTHSLQTLQSDKRASTSLDRVIGAVVLYTFETNLLTSAATIVSMICWLTMPDNLVFMGLHFFISKLYANSLLATLNTRRQLQHQRQRAASADLPAGFPRLSSIPRRTTGKLSSRSEPPTHTKLEITVEKTVEVGGDESSPSESFNQGVDY